MSYNENLQSNNAELEEILNTVNDLPEAGSGTVDLSGYQEKLVSGENIKTINGQSVLGEGDLIVSYDTVCTFSDAIMAWSIGETFPIAFIGDSTFYGTNTSGDGYTFCDKLQSLLREEFGSNATVYRVAKAGARLEYAVTNFASWFGESGTYKDTKMVGIGFGINDRLESTDYKSYYADVYSKVETIVQNCFAVGKQPFIVTSQATTECGIRTDYVSQYPLRTAGIMDLCANNAKKEVAKKYNIPLIDYNDFSEKYLLYSAIGVDTIISDQLHFGDVGHAWAGGFFFSQINPRVIHIKDRNRQIVTYAHQSIESAVPQDKISYGGDYKLYTQYTKSDSSDMKIMDFYIFVEDTQCNICAYKNDTGSTYVSIDGVMTTLSSGETELEQLEMGLHHVEVFTGESTEVDFIGFDINANVYSDNSDSSLIRLSVPIVTISETGLAQWGEVANAAGYKYRIDGGSETFTDTTSVQLELGQNIIVKAVGDGVTYRDSNYTGQNSFGTVVSVNNLNYSGQKTFNTGVYPSVMATGYDAAKNTTAFSGAKIKSFTLKSSNAGTLTIGTTTWDTYGTGVAATVNKARQVELVKGNNVIDLSDLEIGVDETLVIGNTGDTALPYYVTDSSAQYEKLFFVSSSNWKSANIANVTLQLIAEMTYVMP